MFDTIDTIDTIGEVGIFIFGMVLYFIPTIKILLIRDLKYKENKEEINKIFKYNLLLGWTVYHWFKLVDYIVQEDNK